MASSARADELVDHTTKAALEEKAKLQKHFGRFDIFFFLICTLVGLDTLGAVSNDGAQAFTWLVFLGVFFFIPYALLASELGSSFTEEGGAYIWVKLAFGRFTAAINSVLYWLSNPIWLGGTLTILAVTTFGDFFTPLTGIWKYLFSLAFIWFAVWAAILSFGVGKWIPTIGAFVRIAVLGAASRSRSILYALDHGVHGVSTGDFKPTWGIFIAAVPVLFFNFVGFELPNAAGRRDEGPAEGRAVHRPPRDDRDAACSTAGRSSRSCSCCPTAQITSLGGFLDAMKTVFTVYGGHIDDRRGRDRHRDAHRRRQGARRPGRDRLHPGRCCRAAPRGSWAPTARRPSPASTARHRAGSASSPSAGARRSSSTSSPASSRRSSCSWPTRSPAASAGKYFTRRAQRWRSRPRRWPTCWSSRR